MADPIESPEEFANLLASKCYANRWHQFDAAAAIRERDAAVREPLERRIASLEAQLASAPRWIPLTERKPEEGQGVLLLGVYASGEDFFYHPCSWPPVELYDAANDVTHWMPIPPRPAAQKEPHGR